MEERRALALVEACSRRSATYAARLLWHGIRPDKQREVVLFEANATMKLLSFLARPNSPNCMRLYRRKSPSADRWALRASRRAGPRIRMQDRPEPMFESYAEIFRRSAAQRLTSNGGMPASEHAESSGYWSRCGFQEGALCDLPSGGGYLAAQLTARFRYVGVDPSDDFIDACPPASIDQSRFGRGAARRCLGRLYR